MTSTRLIGLAALTVIGGTASAQMIYSNVTATVAFIPSGGGNIPYALSGAQNEMISFDAGSIPVTVGGNTQNSVAVINIVYEVDASRAFAVPGIGMRIEGAIADFGRISWSEIVEDLDNSLRVVGRGDGVFKGASYAGGQNGGISFDNTIPFDYSVTHFKVKKTFTLDIGGQQPPSSSMASIRLIKQTMIPEPATFAALGLGLGMLALLRRRR